MSRFTRALSASFLVLMTACGPQPELGAPLQPGGPGGKADTGWVGSDSFEVGAWLSATATHTIDPTLDNEYDKLDTSKEQQEALVDAQVRYALKTMEKARYYLNVAAESIEIQRVEVDGKRVTLTYRARMDMLSVHNPYDKLPGLEDLDRRTFEVPLPLEPAVVYKNAGESCAKDWKPYTLAEYKYFYYWAPDQEGCTDKIELINGSLAIDTVYPETTAYPEYDRLLRPLDDQGTLGFTAAIMPSDYDGDKPFDRNRQMLKDLTQSEGEELDEGTRIRFRWSRDGATVIIDLFKPTWSVPYWASFRRALGEYDLVTYDGHSQYGSYDLFDNPQDYADRYQIFVVDACHSYGYYARKILRNKGGFDRADVVGTGEASPFGTNAQRVVGALLSGLMDGVSAILRGEEGQAPSWQRIVSEMNEGWDWVYYGAAGVRDNRWQPRLD